MNQNNFTFHIPLTSKSLIKSKDENGKELYHFEGLASNDTEDADGEILNPEGLNIDDFRYINWNHGKDPSDIIGVPTSSKIVPGKGLHIKGALFSNTEKGKKTIELMQALERSNSELGTNVNLGISVEGQVLERNMLNPKRVEKAKITAVAICPFPKNPTTWAALLKKSFTNDENDDIEKEVESIEKSIIFDQIIKGERIIVDSDLNIIKSSINEELVKAVKIVRIGYEAGLVTDNKVLEVKKLIKSFEVSNK